MDVIIQKIALSDCDKDVEATKDRDLKIYIATIESLVNPCQQISRHVSNIKTVFGEDGMKSCLVLGT